MPGVEILTDESEYLARALASKPEVEIPTDESKYLAKRGRKSKNGVAFEWGRDSIEREKVRYLQEALISLGYSLPNHGVDGLFGSETTRAVKDFQKEHKDPFESFSSPLVDDGIVGPKTALALNGALASEGLWFKEYKYEWADNNGDHILHFTKGDKASKITPKEKQDIKIKFGGVGLTQRFYFVGIVGRLYVPGEREKFSWDVGCKFKGHEKHTFVLYFSKTRYYNRSRAIFELMCRSFDKQIPITFIGKSKKACNDPDVNIVVIEHALLFNMEFVPSESRKTIEEKGIDIIEYKE